MPEPRILLAAHPSRGLDLRTIGRSERRNRLTAAYFQLMGFRTLRHLGTADHLHVSLPPRSDDEP